MCVFAGAQKKAKLQKERGTPVHVDLYSTKAVWDTATKGFWGIEIWNEHEPQQSTYQKGDRIWLTSSDTTKVKVYITDTTDYPWNFELNIDSLNAHFRQLLRGELPESYKGGLSITDHNSLWQALNELESSKIEPPFHATYWPKTDTIGPQLRLVSDTAHEHWNGVSAMWVYEVRIYEGIYYAQGLLPKHFCWLDTKKKPVKLKVWEIK